MRNLRELYVLVAALLVGTARSAADGKYNLRDIGNYVNAFLAGEPAIDEISEIPSELAAATPDEKADEVASFEAQLQGDFSEDDAADIGAIAAGTQATVSLISRRAERRKEEQIKSKLASMLQDGTLVYTQPVSLTDNEWDTGTIGTILDTYEPAE